MTADWILPGFAFFGYVAAAALLVRGLPGRTRMFALAGTAVGAGLCAAGYLDSPRLVREWLLPPAILLAAYWTSGLLFVAPQFDVERLLLGIDRTLRIDAAAAALPRGLAFLLEAAYLGIYPLVPLALLIHLMTSARPDPDYFWTVILVTDFICFGGLAWVQTRPPRALGASGPRTSAIRRLNVDLLSSTSIQVNTFPSGHAAEALAVALLLSESSPWLGAAMGLAAAMVSAGAVLGRYHYAADVLAGWIVALLVWMWI
jgi:membrane-associated phospholipid phosphatase